MRRNGTIRISRFKNRFSNRTVGGWADVVLNAAFLDDLRLHVFELQLVHQKFSLMRAQLGGHADYTVTMAATEITLMLADKSPQLLHRESSIIKTSSLHSWLRGHHQPQSPELQEPAPHESKEQGAVAQF